MIRLGRALAGLLCLALLSGCTQTGYLLQAIYGQDELFFRKRDVDEVIRDPTVPKSTRSLLLLVRDVKRFGTLQGLEPTDSYESYVDVGRDAVVYVVSASHPLRFEPKTWSFPVVGEVPYVGWFNQSDAERFAEQLRTEGWDVDLRGAGAYSTLGFFDDPILSTMISPHPSVVGDLANVVLHESVHATHYISSQTYYNESLADFVADRLTPVYLRERLQLDKWQLYEYEEAQIRRDARAERFHQAYLTLERVYASSMNDQMKLAVKARVTESLRSKLGFPRPINNATLAQSRAYHGGVPAFGRVLAHCGNDWERFWKLLRGLSEDSFPDEQLEELAPVLDPLVARPCPP